MMEYQFNYTSEFWQMFYLQKETDFFTDISSANLL